LEIKFIINNWTFSSLFTQVFFVFFKKINEYKIEIQIVKTRYENLQISHLWESHCLRIGLIEKKIYMIP
jgi:hypothetical protein